MAAHYLEDREGFEETAEEWTKKYASKAALDSPNPPRPRQGAQYRPKTSSSTPSPSSSLPHHQVVDGMEGEGQEEGASVSSESVARLCDMGFAYPAVVSALRAWGGDEEGALAELLTPPM